MNKTRSAILLSALLAAALFASSASSEDAKPAAAKKKGHSKEAKVWTASELKWMPVPDGKGVEAVVLSGDPAKGAHIQFLKFPAGISMPLHSHSADINGAVISGTLVLGVEGMPEKELSAGSYIYLPGGKKHTTACKAGADCIVYHSQPGHFDTTMAEGGAAPKK